MSEIQKTSRRRFQVHFFGEVKITDGTRTLREADLHSKQVLRLLVYLFGNTERNVSDSELIDNLWENEIRNPAGALRNLVYRLRKAFSNVWPDVDFLLTSDGQYYINPDLEFDLDSRRFQEIVSRNRDPKRQGSIQEMEQAASLYTGKFVKNLGDFGWSQYVQIWFSEQYVQLNDRLCSALLGKGMTYRAKQWIIQALEQEPHEEYLHVIYLRICLAQQRLKDARKVFQTIVHMFFEEGKVPLTEELEEVRSTYFPDINVRPNSLRGILETIRGSEQSVKFTYVDWREFRTIVSLEERRIADTHKDAQMLLFRLRAEGERSSGEKGPFSISAESQFIKCLNRCLREFDVVTKIRRNEFLILLLNCSREAGKTFGKLLEECFLRATRPRTSSSRDMNDRTALWYEQQDLGEWLASSSRQNRQNESPY